MALFRISRTGAAPPTGLQSSVSSAATSFALTNGTGYPTGAGGNPFVLVLDPGTPLEEKVLCSSLAGTTVTVASGGRGWDGTTAAAHSPGAGNVAHVFSAAEADDANAHIYVPSRDDHTQYAPVNGARAGVIYVWAATNPALPANSFLTVPYDSTYIAENLLAVGFNLSTHTLTCPVGALYRVNAHCSFASGAGNPSLQVNHNGAQVSFSPGAQLNIAYNFYVAETSIIRACNAGDTLMAQAYANAANTLQGGPGLGFITFEIVN